MTVFTDVIVIQKTLKITLMRLDETREKLLITGINNGPCL